MGKMIGYLVVALGVVSGMAAWAQSKPARQIAQEAFPSVVLVIMQDSQGQPASLGSGFVLHDGQVVTNRHVISGSVTGYVRLIGKDMKYEIGGSLAIDDVHDLAVLAVTGLQAPPLPIGDSNQIAVGDEVYAIGNPRGLEGTFSQGIISALRHVGGNTIFQMTAPISPGSSGGPILNSSGKIIGIAVATYADGQNLNLAIPVSYLTALMGGITNDMRPLSRQVAKDEKRSVIGDLGEPSTQGVVGENFEWTDHDNPFYQTGRYSFSLRNQLREAVAHVQFLVIFRDAKGKPIDYDWWEDNTIEVQAQLAKRVADLKVDSSVQRLTRKVEIRVLDFRFVE